LQTGTQIKNRLADSLAKFQEYEGALEAIVKNVDALEPPIKEKLAKQVEDVNDLQQEFEELKGLHNRLQNEKTNLQAAIQACEAAAASVSRPGTPLTASGAPVGAPEREIQLKLKLEDLIDKVREGYDSVIHQMKSSVTHPTIIVWLMMNTFSLDQFLTDPDFVFLILSFGCVIPS